MKVKNEEVDFEKYGFSDIKEIKEKGDCELYYKMKYKGNDLIFFGWNNIGNPDESLSYYYIGLEKGMPDKKVYNAMGQFFPLFLKIIDKDKEFRETCGHYTGINNEILRSYTKQLNEYLNLKKKGERYLKLIENNEVVKIYKFDNRYLTKLHVNGRGYDNEHSMILSEINLDDPKIKKLRKYSKVNIKIYDINQTGKFTDFSLI